MKINRNELQISKIYENPLRLIKIYENQRKSMTLNVKVMQTHQNRVKPVNIYEKYE